MYTGKSNKTIKYVAKQNKEKQYPVVQRFILIVCYSRTQ